jgi:hypothetical protein
MVLRRRSQLSSLRTTRPRCTSRWSSATRGRVRWGGGTPSRSSRRTPGSSGITGGARRHAPPAHEASTPRGRPLSAGPHGPRRGRAPRKPTGLAGVVPWGQTRKPTGCPPSPPGGTERTPSPQVRAPWDTSSAGALPSSKRLHDVRHCLLDGKHRLAVVLHPLRGVLQVRVHPRLPAAMKSSSQAGPALLYRRTEIQATGITSSASSKCHGSQVSSPPAVSGLSGRQARVRA